MNRWRRLLYIILPMLAVLAACGIWLSGRTAQAREEIVITIPDTDNIRSIDTNYYKQWLEEQTGLSIRFNIVPQAHSADYLRSMFASGYVKSDAFFSMLGGEDYGDWNAALLEFGEKGYILPLNDYVEESVYLDDIFTEYGGYDLKAAITSPDGNIYYMPGFDPSIAQSHFQVMWLNEAWMKGLGLTKPQTTDEFRAVLEAFKTGDPNGNSLPDEIPLAGSNDVAEEQIYNYIISAFVYNDPDNARLYKENGDVKFAPVTDEWREAMKYLRGLYDDGLIDPFSYDHRALVGLANDSWDMLGGFASRSITDVIFRTNPELINDITYVAPLTGPEGAQNATAKTPLPRPAGVITSACENPEAVFRLFDLMLSEEAFLIGRYGEPGVDWVHGSVTDMDSYGNQAAVRVINQLQDGVQNKHLGEAGPFFAYPKYSESVTFAGFEMGQEYKNARAYQVYEPFKPEELLEMPPVADALLQEIEEYTRVSIRAFVTGLADPSNDADWAEHIETYEALGIQQLINSGEA